MWTAPWPSAESPFPSPKKTASTASSSASMVISDGATARVGGAFGDLGAFGRQRLRLGARAVVDDDAMSRLDKVQRYRLTHLAKTDKTDVHRCSPCLEAARAAGAAAERRLYRPRDSAQKRADAQPGAPTSISTAGFVARRHICRCCRKSSLWMTQPPRYPAAAAPGAGSAPMLMMTGAPSPTMIGPEAPPKRGRRPSPSPPKPPMRS